MTQLRELANARDLGGLRIVGGGRTRRQMVYRSDAPRPGDATPEGLDPWPPRTVIDLRSSHEKATPHPLAHPAASVIELPLMADADIVRMTDHGEDFSLTDLYLAIVRNCGPEIAIAVRTVAESSGPTLVHCAAGKDRSGVVVAVLLTAVGVERTEILGDYDRTEANMAAVIERVLYFRTAEKRHATEARLRARTAAPLKTSVPALAAALDYLDHDCGGAVSWLLANGVDSTVIERLRDRLVDPD